MRLPCLNAFIWTSHICDLNRTIFLHGTATVASIEKALLPLNLIGTQVRELRDRKGWTQEDLSAKLQVFGWDVSRESLAKLETRQRRVPDGELFILAKVLGTATDALFPSNVNIKKLGPAFRMRLSRNRVKVK
ncbi:MAG: helix-turn-helix transcriptional regulator [Verrucomicrobiia bacterium]